MRQLVHTSLLLIITPRFTCGGRKIFSTIKKSQNIMNMIVVCWAGSTTLVFFKSVIPSLESATIFSKFRSVFPHWQIIFKSLTSVLQIASNFSKQQRLSNLWWIYFKEAYKSSQKIWECMPLVSGPSNQLLKWVDYSRKDSCK